MNGGSQRLSLGRLEALTDGVFAIVITILVLELDVPETHDFSGRGLLSFLSKLEHQVLPYAASFGLTAGYWVLHHVMLSYIPRCDRWFVWLNLLFMLPLSLTPFMVGMRAQYPGQLTTAVLFGAIQLANYFMLMAMWYYARRHLIDEAVPPEVIRGMRSRLLIAVGLIVLGVALVPFSERLANTALIATPLFFIAYEIVDRSKGR